MDIVIDISNYTSNYTANWINNACYLPNEIGSKILNAIITGAPFPHIDGAKDAPTIIESDKKTESEV